MASDQDLPPTRPSSPTMSLPPTRPSSPALSPSTTPKGSPCIESSASAAGSGMQTPVLSESTTPAGSPNAGVFTPETDMAELPPPAFLLRRIPVQDVITTAGLSTPRSPFHGYQHGDLVVSSSSQGPMSSRDALPSQLRQSSLGEVQDPAQLPSRHDPGARMVQLPEAPFHQHRRSKTITSMADILPGPLFARSPVPQNDFSVSTNLMEDKDDPFVGSPLAHLRYGYRPFYEDSPKNRRAATLPSAAEAEDQVLPEMGVERAASTDSVDSDNTVEDTDLYADHENNHSSSDGSPGRNAPGLFANRAGDYNLALGQTFVGAPPDPSQMNEEEVHVEYPLDEVNCAEDEADVGVYDFGYCNGKAPKTDYQWENHKVWGAPFEQKEWSLPIMPRDLAADDNNATVIDMDTLNKFEQADDPSVVKSMRSVAETTTYAPQEQVVAEDATSFYEYNNGTDADDEFSTPDGSPAKPKEPAAQIPPEVVAPALTAVSTPIPAVAVSTSVSAHAAGLSWTRDEQNGEMDRGFVFPAPNAPDQTVSTPIMGGATLPPPSGSDKHRKRTSWGRVREFFNLPRRGSGDEGSKPKSFWRRQLDRFKCK